MRSDAVLDAIGLTEHDPHPAVVDPKRIGANLRHGGDEPLAHRRAAGHQLDRSRRVDGDAGTVQRAEPALLDKNGDACADQLARLAPPLQFKLQSVPADLCQRFVE